MAIAAAFNAAIFFLERVEDDGGVTVDAVEDVLPAARAPEAVEAATAGVEVGVEFEVENGACNGAAAPCARGASAACVGASERTATVEACAPTPSFVLDAARDSDEASEVAGPVAVLLRSATSAEAADGI